MTTPAIDRAGAILTAADITWALGLPPAPPTEAPLIDALVALESYRLLAQQTIHALHALQIDRRGLHERYARLLDEYRTLREQGRGTAA